MPTSIASVRDASGIREDNTRTRHANPHITATIYAHLLGDSELDLAAAAFG